MFASDITESISMEFNPLDDVEEVLTAHDWTFTRITGEELIVQVTGKNCEYRIYFIWQQEMGALQFCCQYDLDIAPAHLDKAAKTLMNLNENLWMGHFDIPCDTMIPTFRQTLLMSDQATNGSERENIHSLIDISMTQCERYFSAFYMLSSQNETIGLPPMDDHGINLALMETMGES